MIYHCAKSRLHLNSGYLNRRTGLIGYQAAIHDSCVGYGAYSEKFRKTEVSGKQLSYAGELGQPL